MPSELSRERCPAPRKFEMKPERYPGECAALKQECITEGMKMEYTWGADENLMESRWKVDEMKINCRWNGNAA